MRIARPDKGKSGSTRVIHDYHNEGKPILLLLIYAQANQENMTDAQKVQLNTRVDAIIGEFG